MLCLVTQDCSPEWPGLLSDIRLLCPWGFSRQEYWSGLPCPPPGDLPNPRIEPRSPILQVDSLPSEPSGKPKNTRVDSLSFLQGIFLTQESNQHLLHCRQILYWLNYQGSSYKNLPTININRNITRFQNYSSLGKTIFQKFPFSKGSYPYHLQKKVQFEQALVV